MKILFITRCYLPVVGGMEKVSFELTTHMAKIADTHLIANRKGKRNLSFFLPYALLRALFLIANKSVDIVHLGDASLAPLGVIVKAVCNLPVVSTVHGLDITYSNKLYQRIIPACLRKIDKLVCISRHTMNECLKRDIPNDKCSVIPNGVNPHEFYLPEPGSREKLETILKIDLADKLLMLSVGHLVARKGIPWFINEVMPKLSKEIIYLVIGGYGNASQGDELQVYSQLIKELGLERQVFLLGEVSEQVLKLAYNSADLLVMPNLNIPGDMEGFGIVALEAASCGLPVLASNLQGIKDAVEDGVTGFLLEAQDSKGYIQKISTYKACEGFDQKAREYTIQNFSWDRMSLRYLEIFKTLMV